MATRAPMRGPPPPHNYGPRGAIAGPAAAPEPQPAVDRLKTCPLLLRVFIKTGAHHQVEDFQRRGHEPTNEIQIYTWHDATLRELCDLVKEVNPLARQRNARLGFAFVYPDKRGINVMRQVGMVQSSRAGDDDDKSLRGLKFQTGDFLDVAIFGGGVRS